MDTQPNAQAEHGVEWEEVARLADDAFDVWSGQPELLWAKQAWEVLAKAGLTAYRSKVEHHHVLFRLLALSGIYSDFCDVAFDEPSEIEYSHFFELDKFVGGQLWARVPGWRFTEEEMEDSDVLDALVEHHRGEVADALVKGYGGESALYESLSKSKESPGEDEEDEFDEDLYEGSSQQGRAYGWITNGCPRLH